MKAKSVIGIVLIIASILGMYFWETELREKMVFTEVLAAAADIHEGDIAGKDSFKVISVSQDSLVSGFLKAENAEELYGKTCVFPLKENALVFKGSFEDPVEEEDDGMYILNIPYSWIFEGSSDMSAGQYALIYSVPSCDYLGIYEVREAGETSVKINCDLESYFSLLSELGKSKDCRLLLVSEK
ncbi:MAG: hypothetical protein J5528_04920 [Firmicutes bacterium]|nr:hypothetical protein [Bacillota bacterium]